MKDQELRKKITVHDAQINLRVAEDIYRENFTRENYERMMLRYHELTAARGQLRDEGERA